MTQLTLDFAHDDGQIQLEKTVFRLRAEIEFIAVRGKTSGAYKCSGSFQWTPAVRAVSVFFVQALARSFEEVDSTEPTISGRRGSLASSLDYAIDKEPQWLCDMFGLDEAGKTNLRRLIFRSNPGGKRPGPVSLGLNESALPTQNITVLLNSIPVRDKVFLDRIIEILRNEPIELGKAPQTFSVDPSLLFSGRAGLGEFLKDNIVGVEQSAARQFHNNILR
jgi:hypothetical protein